MVEPQRDKFWKALVLTVIIFLAGVALGYFIEAGRVNEVQKQVDQAFIDWNNARTQSLYYQDIEPEFCSQAVEENFKFGDRIYEYGLVLEEYEQANRLTESLKVEKVKYNLLKLQFWLNSKNLEEKCDGGHHFILYFYKDEPDNLDMKNQQKVVSRILGDLKEERGSEIILIPLAADFDLGVINIILETNNIDTFPSVLVDDKVVLEGVISMEDIESLIQ